MTRKKVDLVISSAGLVAVVVLLSVGGLLAWGHSFVHDEVHKQLAAQKIFFPPKGSPAIEGSEFAAVRKYAGQQLVTGPQAKAYADHFIAVHLSQVADGKTYSQVSEELRADPNNATLKTQQETLFRGTTLRGMLLDAYAFSTLGRIAGIAMWVVFGGGAVMFVLSILGFVHAYRFAPEAKLGSIVGEQRTAGND